MGSVIGRSTLGSSAPDVASTAPKLDRVEPLMALKEPPTKTRSPTGTRLRTLESAEVEKPATRPGVDVELCHPCGSSGADVGELAADKHRPAIARSGDGQHGSSGAGAKLRSSAPVLASIATEIRPGHHPVVAEVATDGETAARPMSTPTRRMWSLPGGSRNTE